MATKTKAKIKRKQRPLTWAEMLYGKEEVERRWKRAQGLLKGRIPKDPVAWQRKMRRDRKII